MPIELPSLASVLRERFKRRYRPRGVYDPRWVKAPAGYVERMK